MTQRLVRHLTLAAAVAVVAAGATPADEPKGKAKHPANRLAKESSPYLLQHAHNPVDWYPWGTEAFEKARREGKLVFLSIGYSSCHWCHVMERETFSNPEIAKILNANFICIKVDREERPDVDDVYMTALNVTGDSGGWPLSMFLTPDGKPIFGGTYFPPKDKKVGDDVQMGFPSVLARVQELYTKEKDGIFKQADRIAELTNDSLARNTRFQLVGPLTREMVAESAGAYEVDPVHGGTGSKEKEFRGTKFPRAAVWGFLLHHATRTKDQKLAGQVKLTLRQMALGGIYDHLGGGFHRYSTERTWTVPHFEKMLYDNGQLVELYAEAFRTDPDPLYRRVVAETLAFVAREMTSPEGVFYSALDADTEGEEGAFYVWTGEEIAKALGNAADTEFVKTVYGIGAPNFEGKAHVLRLPKPLAGIASDLKITEAQLLERLAPLRARLLDARERRTKPFLDRKVITSWNGLMIAGYAKAGEVFREPAYSAAAAKAADFLLRTLRTPDGRLKRLYAAVPGEKAAPRGNAFLEDYAYLTHGLLNLHDATGEKRWLDEARALADTAAKWHADDARGGFYFTAHDHEKLFARAKEGYDGATPSGNGVMARNLVRLATKTNDAKYRDLAGKSLRAFGGMLRTSPGSAPSTARALDHWLDVTAKESVAVDPPPSPKAPRESADVVKATVTVAEPDKNGSRRFGVRLAITAPYHVYSNQILNKSLDGSKTTFAAFVGGKEIDTVQTFPLGDVVKDAGGDYRIYTDGTTFGGVLPAGVNPADVEFRVRVIACREGTCLLPSTLRVRP
ncbi:thioredoxin domain-containing protein [bacterium]|nr:thioredoxin domain-containing protein [bacterium]